MSRESDFGATLELFFAYDGALVATMAALGSHFWHLRTALGALWGHFGVTWGVLAAYGVTLGPLWGYFEVTLGSVSISVGDFGSVDGYFAMIVESLWVYEGPFSKNIHFPNIF